MQTIHLTQCLSDAEADALVATYLPESSIDTLITQDADVYKPDGSLLLAFRRNALSPASARAAYKALRTIPMDRPSNNRGAAGGPIEADRVGGSDRIAGKTGKVTAYPVKKDGTLSNSNYSNMVPSGVAGYLDRNARFPYCRQTAFLAEQVNEWCAAIPFIQEVDRVFARTVPERHAAQLAMARRTPPEFVIADTAFTTITVNRNWQTAVHKDAGDLPEGFGVLTVCRAGEYTGGHFVLPKYRIGVDMRTCDVLMCDVHEWHGNTPIIGVPGRYERISYVLYYRKNMVHCQSPERELERVKHRKMGDKLVGGDA